MDSPIWTNHNIFVDVLSIGPNDNQIGVILFSDTGRVYINLDSYSSKTGLLTAIQNIPYDGGQTNTPDGLCKLITQGFTESNGARLSSASVSRLAIVLTDGGSNENSPECGNTLQAAQAVHSFEPSITVFAVGVTNEINFEELRVIATRPEYVETIDSFDTSDLQAVQAQQTYVLCNRGRYAQVIVTAMHLQ